MRIIIIILSFFLYQTNTYSKVSEKNEFNQKYLSNYFSALISYDNQKNDDALKFFKSSKFLIQKGYIQRTARGRIALEKAYDYLKMNKTDNLNLFKKKG